MGRLTATGYRRSAAVAIAAVLLRLASRPDRLRIVPRHRAQHARMPGGIGGTLWASPQWRQLCMALGLVAMGGAFGSWLLAFCFFAFLLLALGF